MFHALPDAEHLTLTSRKVRKPFHEGCQERSAAGLANCSGRCRRGEQCGSALVTRRPVRATGPGLASLASGVLPAP